MNTPRWIVAPLILLALAGVVWAQAQGPRSIEEEMTNADQVGQDQPTTPGSDPQPSETSSADDDALITDLMREREEPPEPVAPTQAPPGSDGEGEARTPPVKPMDIDLSVVGSAPPLQGQARPTELRREGEFVVSRRGRVVRAPDANRSLFVFDSDGEALADPPMILLPCQLLENMEQIITDRGDQTVFVITGQVFTYHDVNFLMPTMMKIAVDKGNLN